MHSLTRQKALLAARQRLAAQQQRRIPQGAPQVDVAGCGPGWNQGGYMEPAGMPWTPQGVFESQPQLAPPPFPGLLRSHLYRLGAIVQANENGGARTFELAPPNGASLYVAGFISFNDPFQVVIHSIEQGSIGFSRVSEVDAAIFNTTHCYCALETGCANNLTPLVISFSAFGQQSTLPYLNLAAVGTYDAGWGSCGVPYGDGYNTPLPSMPGTGGCSVPAPIG